MLRYKEQASSEPPSFQCIQSSISTIHHSWHHAQNKNADLLLRGQEVDLFYRCMDSTRAEQPKETQDPHPPWSLTGVTWLPFRFLQSTEGAKAGSAALQLVSLLLLTLLYQQLPPKVFLFIIIKQRYWVALPPPCLTVIIWHSSHQFSLLHTCLLHLFLCIQ